MENVERHQWEKRDDESSEQHAQRIADSVRLRVEIKRGRPQCPKWGKAHISGPTHCPYGKCNGYHGTHWGFALHTPTQVYTSSFWASVADDAKPHHVPSTYDILACLDWCGAIDPDEIGEEYGPMKPSQAIACAEQNRALRGLFVNSWQRERLAQIS